MRFLWLGCVAVLSIALITAAANDVQASPGAEVHRADHVRVWVSDPQLMPTRADGSAWVQNGESPKLQVTITLKRGTARSKVVKSSSPQFGLAPFNVKAGQRVRIRVWELGEFGKELHGAIDFVAGNKPDSFVVTSEVLLLFGARAEPIDVWAIDELAVVVPFRVDEEVMKVVENGLEGFHKRIQRSSRGQIRIKKYRYYEMPSASAKRKLSRHRVVLSKKNISKLKKGTPRSPAKMTLGSSALANSGEFTSQLYKVFERGVLGSRSQPDFPPKVSASKKVVDKEHPWCFVRQNLKNDLKVALLPALDGQKAVAASSPDIDIVRGNTVEF